jgi:hypothetical protein
LILQAGVAVASGVQGRSVKRVARQAFLQTDGAL